MHFFCLCLPLPWKCNGSEDPKRSIGKIYHDRRCLTKSSFAEYERFKIVADKIAMEEASNRLPIIILYPGFIYGPGKIMAGNVVARILIECLNGRLPGYIGYGTDKESFSHGDDVVDDHILALQKGRDGERYLLTGENAFLVNVFYIEAIITNTSRPRLHVPFWVIEAYGWITVFWAKLTGNLPLISYPGVNVSKQ